MRKYFMVPSIAGVMKDLHPRAIPDHRCQDALNVLFEEGRVRTRWGYNRMSANLPLSGPITHIIEFDQIITGERFLLVCTTRDVYVWDISRGVFTELTDIVESECNFIFGSQVSVHFDANNLDPHEMSLQGIYRVRFEMDGIYSHDNIVSQVNDSDHITLSENYIWCPFYIWQTNWNYYRAGTIINQGLGFPNSTYIFGQGIGYDPDLEEWVIHEQPAKSIFFRGTPIPGLNDNEEYYPIPQYQAMEPLRGTYWLLRRGTSFAFTADVEQSSMTLTNVVGTGITIGALLRVSSVSVGGLTAVNVPLWLEIYAYNEETNVISYRFKGFGPESAFTTDALYNMITISWGMSATGVSFNCEFFYIDLSGIPQGPRASIRYTEFDVEGQYSASAQMRLCFSGTIEQYHDSAIIYDDEIEDKVIAITNGIEKIKVWRGSGNLFNLGERFFYGNLTSGNPTITSISALGPLRKGMSIVGAGIPANAVLDTPNYTAGTVQMLVNGSPANATQSGTEVSIRARSLPDKAKYIDYFGSVGMEHVITASTIDSISGVNNVQTLQMSDAGEIDLWNSIFYDLIDTNDPIVGVKRLQTQLIIYKERSISIAIPNQQGGNQDPLELVQNKVSIGTPSGRTVVDFGDFHIFFGWDNIYAFNGIGVKQIGSDIINDLNSGINRPFINRSFAFSIPNKNVYCLFVPYGFEVENCNRAYVYNYKENHWTIWQLSHELTAFGTYHQGSAPTWADLLGPDYRVDTTATRTSGNNIITVSNATGIEVYNVIEGTGIPEGTNVTAIYGLQIEMSNPAQSGGSGSVQFFKSWRNMNMRWADLILYEDNARYVVGDVNGNIYEISDRYFDDNGELFQSFFITRDFALSGNAKQNFKLVETVIGICDEQLNSDAAIPDHTFGISASIDFGVNWTEEIIVDIANGSGYVEQIVNWIERGRQVRFRITNSNGSYFKIESLNIGFNDSGVLKTNYN